MDEILIACGDVDLLRKIAGDLPQGRFKPIATRTGAGIAQKLAGRNVSVAIVHDELADGTTSQLLQKLRQLDPAPAVLLLTSSTPPETGDFDVALRYPVPGPVLRNALGRLQPPARESEDLEQWRAFYRELKAVLERARTQNYYELFGLRAGAPHHAIVRRYDAVSLRYHPDRYARHRDTKWGAAIYDYVNELYKLYTDAFSVLTDRRLRRKYDEALTAGRHRLSAEEMTAMDSGPRTLEELASNGRSRKFLRLAQSDIARQDWQSALQNLKFARSMEGDSPAIDEKIAEIESKLGS